MNERSSRSHTICKLTIEQEEHEEHAVVKRSACLSLVDLAGSERQADTNASGKRLKEGSNINKSLLTLGRVINRLTEQASRERREARRAARSGKAPKSPMKREQTKIVPYRESKLTRILKQSLGGNARTTILCTITAAPEHEEETVSTLRFGQLCKLVKNEAKENVQMSAKEQVTKLQSEVEALREALAKAHEHDDLGLEKDGASTPPTEDQWALVQARFQHKFAELEEDSGLAESLRRQVAELSGRLEDQDRELGAEYERQRRDSDVAADASREELLNASRRRGISGVAAAPFCRGRVAAPPRRRRG